MVMKKYHGRVKYANHSLKSVQEGFYFVVVAKNFKKFFIYKMLGFFVDNLTQMIN
jgi:hypothetical protein